MAKKSKSKQQYSDESEEESEAVASSESEEEEVVSSSKRKKSRGKAASSKKKRRTISNDDSDEAEAAVSDEEATMDTNDTALPPPPDDDDAADDPALQDPYDEQLYKLNDPADRLKLDAMTQAEREAVLYERSEERDRIQKRLETIRRVDAKSRSKQQAESAPSRRTRRAKPSEDDEPAGSSRRGAGRTASSALADLQARRRGATSQKQSDLLDDTIGEAEDVDSDAIGDDDDDEADPGRMSRKQRRREQRMKQGRAAASDLLSDGDDETGGSASKLSASQLNAAYDDEVELKTKTTIRLQDVKSLQLRRTALEKLYDTPYFNDYVTQMFILVTVGKKQDGSVAYRLGQIIAVDTMPDYYEFPPRSRKRTNIALRLKHGQSERLFPLTTISNNSIPDKEFLRWKQAMDEYNLPLLTAEQVFQIKRRAEKLRLNFTYTPDVIEKMRLQREQQLQSTDDQHSFTNLNSMNITKEKAKLMNQIADANDPSHYDAPLVQKLMAQLTRLQQFEQSQKQKQTTVRASNKSGITINDTNALIKQKQFDEVKQMRKQARELAATGGITRDVLARTATRPDNKLLFDEEKASPEKMVRKLSVDMTGKVSPEQKAMGTPEFNAMDDSEQFPSLDLSSPNNQLQRRVSLSIPQHPRIIELPTPYKTLSDRSMRELREKFTAIDLPIDIDALRSITDKQQHANGRMKYRSQTRHASKADPFTQLPVGAQQAIQLQEYWAKRET